MSKTEWAAVVLMFALALSVGLPYLQKSREISRRNTCDQRLVQLAQAMQRFDQLHHHLPGYRSSLGETAKEAQTVSWVYALAPFLGLAPTPEELKAKHMDSARRSPWEARLHRAVADNTATTLSLPPLWCPDVRPDESRPARMHFVANCGLPDAQPTAAAPADWPANGVLQDRLSLMNQETKLADHLSFEQIDARDGCGTTLLFTENIDAGDWTDDEESLVSFLWLAEVREGALVRNPELFGINQQRGLRGAKQRTIGFARPASYHPGGVNVVYCDGHSAFVNEHLEYELFVRVMTVDDTQLKFPGQDKLFPPPIRIEPEFFKDKSNSRE